MTARRPSAELKRRAFLAVLGLTSLPASVARADPSAANTRAAISFLRSRYGAASELVADVVVRARFRRDRPATGRVTFVRGRGYRWDFRSGYALVSDGEECVLHDPAGNVVDRRPQEGHAYTAFLGFAFVDFFKEYDWSYREGERVDALVGVPGRGKDYERVAIAVDRRDERVKSVAVAYQGATLKTTFESFSRTT